MADSEVSSKLETLNMNGEVDSEGKSDISTDMDENWGLPRSEVYKIALKFYKGALLVTPTTSLQNHPAKNFACDCFFFLFVLLNRNFTRVVTILSGVTILVDFLKSIFFFA